MINRWKNHEGTYFLTETEIDNLFNDICDGNEPEFEILKTPQPVFGIIPDESSIVVSGRYEGTIVLTTNRSFDVRRYRSCNP